MKNRKPADVLYGLFSENKKSPDPNYLIELLYQLELFYKDGNTITKATISEFLKSKQIV